MKYGCIGEHLPHSFSREIHAKLDSFDYELCELTPCEVGSFLRAGDFLGINVTIPYKQTVIPYLDDVSDAARAIGAVNTIVNRNGKLYGTNTDFGGMRALIGKTGVTIKGKKVLVLGTGGTAKTAVAVAASLGARTVIPVSRTAKGTAISYEEAYSLHTDADVILNTTPSGMFPDPWAKAIDPARFPSLAGVIDAVYNPLRTELVLSAREAGVRAEGGLYMLVAQAVEASEYFLGKTYEAGRTDAVFRAVAADKENIVLCGMPGSGKSTVGALLAASLGRELVDTDRRIEEKTGKTIPEIFAGSGEEGFRAVEREVIASLAPQNHLVIATGGGAILSEENVRNLRRNGRLYFLDRPLAELLPTEDRPLALTREAIAARYHERYDRYLAVADERIVNGREAQDAADSIERSHFA